MSARFVASLVIVLLIGIALGVGALALIQTTHIFAAPVTPPPPHMHW